MHPDTLEAITRSAAIPSMPLVASRCYEITQDPMCSYNKLVEVLSTDPGMAGEVLRLSNSAMFGVSRQVESLKQAIALLGIRRVRDLVLTRYMVQTLDQIKTDPIDISYFWRRSVTTAVVATRLAAEKAPRRRDEMFIAALLADVGVIVLLRALPDKYRRIAAAYRPLGGEEWLTQEQVALGVEHGEVSARVLEAWNLPASMAEAVRYHHTRTETIPEGNSARELAPIIHVAGVVAAGLCEARDPAVTAERFVKAMADAGFVPSDLVTVLSSVETDVLNLAAMLKVDVVPAKTYKLIAEKVCEKLAQPVG